MVQNATIVFDTSALLDLYYYSPNTREEIFSKVFAYLEKRLFVPAQVYFEYLKNKSFVSNKPINSYLNLISKDTKTKDGGYVDKISEISREIETRVLSNLEGQLQTLKEKTQSKEKHPYFDTAVYSEFEESLTDFKLSATNFIKKTDEFKHDFEKKVDERIHEIEKSEVDVVYDAIKNHFQIGKEFSFSDMLEIAKEGAFRYSELIPPGYKDSEEKIGLHKYGDLYLWKQILLQAKQSKKDFILVINDLKEDWFEKDKKNPRYELLKEFHTEAGKSIWFMPMSLFLYHINNLLEHQLDENTISDVTTVLENRESKEIEETYIFESVQQIISQVLNDNIYLMEGIPINNAIRIFDNPLLYEAENEDAEKYRIVVTIIGSGNYAKVLHSMTNAYEIRKFYQDNNEVYRYYNFIIFKRKDLVEKFNEHLLKRKVKNLFNSERIKTIICYNEDDTISVYKTNFTEG